jgi:hypothetical protein
MGWGDEERGYSYMKILIKGYEREKSLGYTVLEDCITFRLEQPTLAAS